MVGLSVVDRRDDDALVDIGGRVGWCRCGLLNVNAASRGRHESRRLADMNFMFGKIFYV